MSPSMRDEQLLASLVLLLRSPTATGHDGGADPDGVSQTPAPASGSAALRGALERDDCRLLCFATRLVRHYATAAGAGAGGASTAAFAFLRLATRVTFVRYASPSLMNDEDEGECDMEASEDDHREGNDGKIDTNNRRICKFEMCLLDSLLAALRAREDEEMTETDVEMAWVAQNLLIKLSIEKLPGNKPTLSPAWAEAIDALVVRRREHKKGVQFHTTMRDGEVETDEHLMIKTIHTILDRDNAPDKHQANEEPNDDWNSQYEIALVSCVQSFLQACPGEAVTGEAVPGGRNHPLWSRHTLFGLMRWSQQNEALSVEVYRLTLHFIQMCVVKSGERSWSDLNYFFSSFVANDSPEEADNFSTAMRSFVLYGLVVLCNASNTQSKGKSADFYASDELSLNTMRGDIYFLTLELWQLVGPDWLYVRPLSEKSTEPAWWWFQSGGKKDEELRLGPTWPLCTLVRLAAGEFRLGLGRYITDVENGGGSAEEHARLNPEILCGARIIIEAVRLMTTISEDPQAMMMWTPDSILHVRKSLEDALAASVQCLNSLSEEIPSDDLTTQNEIRPLFSDGEEIGLSCCLVMGAIASELEVDHLLASVRQSNAREESCHPCLASALRFGLNHATRYMERDDRVGSPISRSNEEALVTNLRVVLNSIQ